MAEYGPFADIVAGAGSLIAASSAVGLAWMRRAKWLPPGEVVSGSTAKVSALVSAVVIGILFVYRNGLVSRLPTVAGASLLLALVGLAFSIYLNVRFSMEDRRVKSKPKRVLGGFALTDEARAARALGKFGSDQQLFENANWIQDLVWTRTSIALVHIGSAFAFILLQACGSIAIATAALLVSVAGATPVG